MFKRNVEGLINEYNEMLKREKENYKMQKNVLEEESKEKEEKNNLKRKENQENPNDIELILNENIQTLKNLTKEQNKLLKAVKHIFVKFKQKHFAGKFIEFIEVIELYWMDEKEQIQPLLNTIKEIISGNDFLINDEKSIIVQMASILNKISKDNKNNCSLMLTLKNLVSFFINLINYMKLQLIIMNVIKDKKMLKNQ